MSQNEKEKTIDKSPLLESWMLFARLEKKVQSIEKIVELPYGITTSQYKFVVVQLILSDKHGATQSEIAARAHIDKALISRYIAELEEKGIVSRNIKDGEQNPKKYKIFLTEKGLSVFEQAKNAFKTAFQKVFKNITEEEMESFIRILFKLVEEDLQ